MSSHRLTPEQQERYARHIVLPGVGGRGQRALLDARVFVMGAGGLGSPVLMYLAAAGVGTIEICDADVVDLSNLQRQIIHSTQRIGEPKTASARATLESINPDITLIEHRTRLTPRNAATMMSLADVIVEGSDNFPTRYAVSDAAVALGVPLVSGAMYRFEGHVTVFPNDGGADSPCYRCLFPEPPPPGAVASCQEAGIFGSVPGVIGSLQATEVIKLIVGLGEPLAGRMVLWNALEGRFREVKLHRDEDCAVCGKGRD